MNSRALRILRGRLVRYVGAVAVVLGVAGSYSFLKTDSSELDASPTAAFSTMGPNVLRNWQTGYCLDSDATGAVSTSFCQLNKASQNWIVVYDNHVRYDQVKFMNQATGRYLNWTVDKPVTSDYVPSDKAEYVKQVWQAVGANWQKVQFMDLDTAGGKGLCLGDYGNWGVLSTACESADGIQQWKLGF